jgi:hypothetical protein
LNKDGTKRRSIEAPIFWSRKVFSRIRRRWMATLRPSKFPAGCNHASPQTVLGLVNVIPPARERIKNEDCQNDP